MSNKNSIGHVLNLEDRAAQLDREHKWDLRMMEMAKLVASWSKDPGTKVGAVIADDNRVISVGYNGLPALLPDVNLHDRPSKLSRTVHAELNAIFNARGSVAGFTLYVWPLAPCDRCSVHVIAAGIDRVVAQMPPAHDVAGSEALQRWQDSAKLSEEYFRDSGIDYVVLPS